MTEVKVYLIETDIGTRCHCGHRVEVGERYYIMRTPLPWWVSLCENCKRALDTPVHTTIKQLIPISEWGKKEIFVPVSKHHKKSIEKILEKMRKRDEERLEKAIWV